MHLRPPRAQSWPAHWRNLRSSWPMGGSCEKPAAGAAAAGGGGRRAGLSRRRFGGPTDRPGTGRAGYTGSGLVPPSAPGAEAEMIVRVGPEVPRCPKTRISSMASTPHCEQGKVEREDLLGRPGSRPQILQLFLLSNFCPFTNNPTTGSIVGAAAGSQSLVGVGGHYRAGSRTV